jgi:hypothetical protein
VGRPLLSTQLPSRETTVYVIHTEQTDDARFLTVLQVNPRINYNTVGGVNGPLVILGTPIASPQASRSFCGKLHPMS